MSRIALKIFFIILVAFNLTAVTGFQKPCAMPCCAGMEARQVVSDCDECEPANLSEPMQDCCSIQNGDAQSLTTLNTWTAAADNPAAAAGAAPVVSRATIPVLAGSRDIPSGGFESPPIYLRVSSFLC